MFSQVGGYVTHDFIAGSVGNHIQNKDGIFHCLEDAEPPRPPARNDRPRHG
jgi:hypothetical protein